MPWRFPLVCVLLLALAGCAGPLPRAIARGDTAAVLAQLDKGADVNAKFGTAKLTPLKLAADCGRLGVAKALVDRGADVNAKTGGTSALAIAAIKGRTEFVTFLLGKGAQVTQRDILWAEKGGNPEIADLLRRSAAESAAKAAAAAKPAVPPAGPASGVDTPSYQTGERPDDFAVVIGIEKYPDLPEARFAERDAQAVMAHLRALGVPERNIVHLSGAQAGRARIEKYLERWLPNNAGENSRIFFYFAGNGGWDAKTGQAFLMPWEADAELPGSTGYPVQRLFEKLTALKAKEAVAILDAGFAGSGARSVSPQAAAGPAATVGDSGDVIAFLAAQGREEPLVLEDQEHGALTYCLLEGLNGAAANKFGGVTVQGLYSYLRAKVQEAAARQGRQQTPRLLTGSLGEVDPRLR